MKRFSLRKYISIALALSFLIVVISGLVLYIAPPGSIARWQAWRLLFLSRAEWETQHTIFSYALLVFVIIHLFTLNWKIFVSYLVNGMYERLKGRKEAIVALATVVFLFSMTFFRVPPVISVMDAGNAISDTWEKRNGSPPETGLEELSVGVISVEYLGLDTGELSEILKSNGINSSGPGQSLSELASINNTTPSRLFAEMLNWVSDKRSEPATKTDK